MVREKPDRDWKEYNERLVQWGEILLAVESLAGWQGPLSGDRPGAGTTIRSGLMPIIVRRSLN